MSAGFQCRLYGIKKPESLQIQTFRHSRTSSIFLCFLSHTFRICIRSDGLLQLRIFDMVNLQIRKNPLEKAFAEFCILHDLPKQKIIAYTQVFPCPEKIHLIFLFIQVLVLRFSYLYYIGSIWKK